MSTTVNWFEIPVSDMERAQAFYSQILGVQLQIMEMPGMRIWPCFRRTMTALEARWFRENTTHLHNKSILIVPVKG
ncbi:MAG TPA: hypothetical protein ENI98_13185 [Gammaproteobacteria bacterium]|nr:hypothetical protein [Gammaproteobacteria bacterium]